jgi:hypothetical protein
VNSIDGKKESEKYFYQFCTEFFMHKKVMKGTKAQHGGNLTEYIDSGDFHHIHKFFLFNHNAKFFIFSIFIHFFIFGE